jgi:hypothetical protein
MATAGLDIGVLGMAFVTASVLIALWVLLVGYPLIRLR